MVGEIDGTSFRVDACVTSEPASDVTVLADIAVVLEFKRLDEDMHNRRRLISKVSQIMNDDPRRTWIYGVTIEGTTMSVWYFCRSHSVKSTAFNLATDIKTFIQVFMSFLYATPEEIGYDPTIHRALYNDKFCYIYKLETNEGPKYFRTVEPLFNSRVLCITGRKTRVWRAIEIGGLEGLDAGNGASEVALKDVWLDDKLATEKENQDKIFRALGRLDEKDYDWATGLLREKLKETIQNKRYRDYFLEIKYDTLLSRTKPLSGAATHAPDLLHHTAPAASLAKIIKGSSQIGASSSTPGKSIHSRHNPSFPRNYQVKKHYRLVYDKVGHSLDKATNLDTSFVAILDVFIALVLLYLARWVHRDVSTGNIILVGVGGEIRGKLSDVEYAKEFYTNTCTSDDPKTGTPFFMAVEIHSSRLIYVPPQEETRSLLVGSSTSAPDAPLLHFCFQHDLESLWWVIIWIFLCRVKTSDASKLADDVFTSDYTPTRKRVDFLVGSTLKHRLPGVVNPHLVSLVGELNYIRAVLCNSYTDKEMFGNRSKPVQYATIY
ncbi:hypothetical protein P691DRAFT_712676, partial [Macrolepiota fuliginosa MF-IS2]